jgi:hypothetical protein
MPEPEPQSSEFLASGIIIMILRTWMQHWPRRRWHGFRPPAPAPGPRPRRRPPQDQSLTSRSILAQAISTSIKHSGSAAALAQMDKGQPGITTAFCQSTLRLAAETQARAPGSESGRVPVVGRRRNTHQQSGGGVHIFYQYAKYAPCSIFHIDFGVYIFFCILILGFTHAS